MVERMLADAAHADGPRSVSLRYLNTAGASSDCDIGEAHDPETRLVTGPLTFQSDCQIPVKTRRSNAGHPQSIFGPSPKFYFPDYIF